MLLAYDKSTGKVLWNSGTNSAFPDGPPDEVAYRATNVSVGLLRLNDLADAQLVALVMTQPTLVKDGKVVIGESTYTPIRENPDPARPPLPLDQQLARMQAEIDQLRELVMLTTLGGLS